MSVDVSAEVGETTYEFDGSYFTVKQVRVEIYGQEFFLDPDQAHNLKVDIDTALYEIGEN